MPNFIVRSHTGQYIGSVKAPTPIDAFYALYHFAWGGYPGHGEVLHQRPNNIARFIVLGEGITTSYFSNLVAQKYPLSFPEIPADLRDNLEKMALQEPEECEWYEVLPERILADLTDLSNLPDEATLILPQRKGQPQSSEETIPIAARTERHRLFLVKNDDLSSIYYVGRSKEAKEIFWTSLR